VTQAATAGVAVAEDCVTFRLADPDRELTSVRLLQEVRRPRDEPLFERAGAEWWATFPRLGVDRMEYQVALERADRSTEVVCDPSNPLRARGPFGEKSVIEFPGYHAPNWVEREPRDPGEIDEIEIRSITLPARLPVAVWTSPGGARSTARPILVVHDGPEYDAYSGLLRFLALAVEDGRVPPMRAALLPPQVDRNQIYSASAAYSRALSHEILPALAKAAPAPPGRAARVGMGASLGALAMLHAHRAHPAAFGALFLQSGSFFRQRFDRQESGFVRFRRISRFVGTVLTAEDWAHPIPVTMTCGSVEENLANNGAVAVALAAQDYDVSLKERSDAHNWIAWRDVFDPHLVALLQKVWT
jgi:enterochelin esterase-like enzyme